MGRVEPGTTPNLFKSITLDKVSEFHLAWTLTDENKRPIGVVGGLNLPISVSNDILDYVTVIYADDWFPWATPRQIIASSVNFIHRERKNRHMMWYSDEENKPFNVHICRYGIARRIGTVNLRQRMAVFESLRSKKWHQ